MVMALGVYQLCLSVVFLSSLQRLLIGTFGAEETGLTRNKLPVVSATSVALHLRGIPRFVHLVIDRQMVLASFACVSYPIVLER